MLQILLWWIAPLAIFLIKRNSKFVSFHALQALLLQAVYVLTIIAGLILAFGVFVWPLSFLRKEQVDLRLSFIF